MKCVFMALAHFCWLHAPGDSPCENHGCFRLLHEKIIICLQLLKHQCFLSLIFIYMLLCFLISHFSGCFAYNFKEKHFLADACLSVLNSCCYDANRLFWNLDKNCLNCSVLVFEKFFLIKLILGPEYSLQKLLTQ